ncbi:hypothetical protein ACIBUR_21610 [Streptomyces anulatus]
MKQQRSSEESEPGNGREAASGETAPDSAQGSGPGSIGAPSAPASRTATQGGDSSVAGDGDDGGARTPTSSAPGPAEAGEREAGAPAAVHVVGVSIGRTTAGAEEQPEGSAAAAAREEEAETAGGSTVAATATAATAAAGAVPAAEAATANSAEETAEAKTAAPAGAAAAAAAKTAATESGATKAGPASQKAAGTAGAATAETAASGATVTATSTATATVAASPPDSASATEGGAPERPGRVSRPMVVAAAFAGALLLGAPFVVAGAQKDDGKPTRGEAAAAAWKQDGQEGGYVPGTDPAGPDGVRAPGSPEQGVPPVRGDKGPANHVRADAGDGPQRANGSPETERGDGAKGSTGTKEAGSTGTGGTTDKNGSGAKAPAGTGSEGSAKAPSAETAPQSQPQTTPKAPTVVYSGVSGHECPTQRFQRDGYYSDGKEGWATHSGGFGGYGCAGKYLSMPMSGSSSKDSGGSATWLFDLPASAKKCSISVHVPGSSDIVRVGGDPSYYTVYDRFLPRTNNLVGSFYVNQQDRRGTWYNVPGTFAVDAKKLSVRIHDRGRDSKYEHHAISTIKATCTG